MLIFRAGFAPGSVFFRVFNLLRLIRWYLFFEKIATKTIIITEAASPLRDAAIFVNDSVATSVCEMKDQLRRVSNF
jgi:hypothetical protein